MTTVAAVNLWGRTIGAVALEDDRDHATFAFDRAFARSGIEPSPLRMPLSQQVYAFPHLERQTFHGLPGMLADSLPDKFGNALIDAWLARSGRSPESFNAVERLCYIGTRGMGALEFEPTLGPEPGVAAEIQIASLVALASEILTQRQNLQAAFDRKNSEQALTDILRVGTSAGGARAKALIAWNPQTREVRSGQIDAGSGFEHWLLKFDGVSGNKDKELEDPKGYGDIEYAYHHMAREAGIHMETCRILEENNRRHFMTRRFDRLEDGSKLHMQSLCALDHLDFNMAGAHAYEQALMVIRRLGLSMDDIEQQFRRMAFNIVGRNQDDHTKNIAFLMNKSGRWSLAPAFDVTYSHNPDGRWTASHQMTLNGKRDGFTRDDFRQCAKTASMKRGRADAILDEVRAAVRNWPEHAAKARIPAATVERIQRAHRLDF